MFQIILLTVAVSLQYVQVTSQVTSAIDDPTFISKPKITQSPSHTVLYSADNVTLKCEVPDAPSGVQYEWYKDSTQLGSHTDKLTITEPGGGSYQCKAKVAILESVRSDPYTLTVQTIPTAITTLESKWAEVYQSEKVNLKCEIQGSSEAWIYKWYKNGVSLQESNSQLKIQSATMDTIGDYTCQGSLQNRVNTERSNALTLKVNAIPRANLTLVSKWAEVYPSEKVNLKCEIQGSSESWTYKWYRNGLSLQESNSQLNIQSTTMVDSGNYTCQGSLQERVNTKLSSALTVTVHEEKPKPNVQMNPAFDVLYNPETVTLNCNIQSIFTEWEYIWYKNSKEPASIISGQGSHPINSVQLSDKGIFWCQAKRDNFYSMHSNPLFLNITETPKPKLTVDPTWTEFFPSEKITLKCGFDGGSSGWSFQWIKDGHSFDNPDSQPKIITVNLTDSGQYTCKGILYNRPVNTQESDAFLLKVNDHWPKPLLSRIPDFQVIYTEEQVTFNCEVKVQSSEWEYLWFKDSEPIHADTSKNYFSISSAQVTDGREYCCKVRRRDLSSDQSEINTLTVKEPPVPQVRSDWTEAFPGETVSLQCVIEGVSENWIYMWFIGSIGHENRAGKNLSLSVNSSHDGVYVCQAELQGRSVKTPRSQKFQLKVYGAQPTVLLNQDPKFPLIYTQEQVKLICSINEQTSNWEYRWYKVPDKVNSIFSNANYTISNATLSHNGIYTCHVRRRDKQFPSNKFHNLTIREPPQPNVSIESQWKTFYATEKVNLRCSINGFSNEWNYEWFRNGTNVSKDKDISLFGTTLSINLAKISHSGWYTCRGKHVKRLPVTTREAEALRLQIYDNTPNPKTGKHPSFDFFYTEEQVQLDCSMPGNGWEYHWYEDSKRTEPPSTDPTYNISSASFSHTFYCKAKRGDFSVQSENVEVKVKARPPAVLTLETEWGDIMAGNILTLKCEITDEREWNYTWYENGLKLNGSLDIYKVTASEETIKSEFKCKGIRTERPLYSDMSEGFIANNTVFKRKILLAISGCLICCIVILIIGCVILKFTRKSEKKETYRVTEDLFFSMADSKNQTAAPLKEYMDNKPTDSEMKECDEKELLSDCTSAVHVDGVIKDEDSPSTEANGLTSFKGP